MRLSNSQLIAYGLPGLPLALLGLPLVIYLPPVYAEDFGIGLSAVGGALLIARLWDLISDPLLGHLGDLLPYRRKRLILILAGTPMLLLAADALFRPASSPDTLHLLLWSLVLYTGWTAVVMSYSAWGAEISKDYRERSHVTAVREGFILLGTLSAVLLPALFGLADAQALSLLGGFFIISYLLSLPGLWHLPSMNDSTGGSVMTLSRGIRLLRENRPLRQLLLAYLFNGIANGIPAALFLLFVEHVLGRPEQAWLYLAVYFCAGMIGFTVFLPLAKRLGKHRAWALSMLFACLVFAWVPLAPLSEPAYFILICLLTGLSLGVDMSLPSSIQADVIDLDRSRGGGERAGLFFGLWGMATKLALALAIGISFPLIELAGFDPAVDGSNTWVLLLTYGLLPLPFKLLAAGWMWNFPLDQSAVQALQRRNHVQNPHRTGHSPDPDPDTRRMLDHEA